MYPPLCDVDVDRYGIATLPDGRRIRVHQTGHVEGDTNAFVEESLSLVWDATGDELEQEEFNAEIEHAGRKYFIHEFAVEFAKWSD